ncbi:MAG: hypothetical protein O2910_06630 [Proteobacteria bacterium]|nr:hypothetical protein [Pseudomonadota bacterium]
MSDPSPGTPSAFSRWTLAICIIIAGVGIGALVRELAIDNDSAVERRKDELFSDKILRDHTTLLIGRNPVKEATDAMARDDFRLLERETPSGALTDGVTCTTPPATKPVVAFEDTIEPGTMRSFPEQEFFKALSAFVRKYNAAVVRNPVFADLWGCTIDRP